MLVTLQISKERNDIINNVNNIVYEIKILDNMINRKIITDTKQYNIPTCLSPTQIKILHYLYQQSNAVVCQHDIEKIIESRRSTTSGILQTMEKNNLIQRVNHQGDARSKQIILTPYSLELSKTMTKLKDAFDKQIESSITEEDLKTFFKVTQKIKDNIINMK